MTRSPGPPGLRPLLVGLPRRRHARTGAWPPAPSSGWPSCWPGSAGSGPSCCRWWRRRSSSSARIEGGGGPHSSYRRRRASRWRSAVRAAVGAPRRRQRCHALAQLGARSREETSRPTAAIVARAALSDCRLPSARRHRPIRSTVRSRHTWPRTADPTPGAATQRRGPSAGPRRRRRRPVPRLHSHGRHRHPGRHICTRHRRPLALLAVLLPLRYRRRCVDLVERGRRPPACTGETDRPTGPPSTGAQAGWRARCETASARRRHRDLGPSGHLRRAPLYCSTRARLVLRGDFYERDSRCRQSTRRGTSRHRRGPRPRGPATPRDGVRPTGTTYSSNERGGGTSAATSAGVAVSVYDVSGDRTLQPLLRGLRPGTFESPRSCTPSGTPTLGAGVTPERRRRRLEGRRDRAGHRTTRHPLYSTARSSPWSRAPGRCRPARPAERTRWAFQLLSRRSATWTPRDRSGHLAGLSHAASSATAPCDCRRYAPHTVPRAASSGRC